MREVAWVEEGTEAVMQKGVRRAMRVREEVDGAQARQWRGSKGGAKIGRVVCSISDNVLVSIL